MCAIVWRQQKRVERQDVLDPAWPVTDRSLASISLSSSLLCWKALTSQVFSFAGSQRWWKKPVTQAEGISSVACLEASMSVWEETRTSSFSYLSNLQLFFFKEIPRNPEGRCLELNGFGGAPHNSYNCTLKQAPTLLSTLESLACYQNPHSQTVPLVVRQAARWGTQVLVTYLTDAVRFHCATPAPDFRLHTFAVVCTGKTLLSPTEPQFCFSKILYIHYN